MFPLENLFLIKKISNTKTAYFDKNHEFLEIYDRNNDFYLRKVSVKTHEEAFMRSFPTTLTISIVGGCKSRDVCYLDCCAGKKEYDSAKDMPFEPFKKIIDEGVSKGLLNIILTGSGDPNDHPDFKEFVLYAKKNRLHITCQTSGATLKEEDAFFFKQNIHKVNFNLLLGNQNSLNALKWLFYQRCKISLNLVVSSLLIDTVSSFLSSGVLEFDETGNLLRFKGENTIGKLQSISLHLQKRKGLGTLASCVSKDQKDEVIHLVKTLKRKSTIPVVLEPCFQKIFAECIKKKEKQIELPSCECGRYSAFITENLTMIPCEFVNMEQFGESIISKSIESVFLGEKFSRYREAFINCKNCVFRSE